MPGQPHALRIAIVGAESTGKTTLARGLAAALAAAAVAPAPAHGGRVALVGEVLREWCAAAGRTPRREEQQGILLEQHRRIDSAAATHDIVVSDTTALMTHVYSDLLFDDRSLQALAVQQHRRMTATLLTALDLPWVADGHQRDGEHVRQPVDDRVRELLLRHALPFSVVAGRGPARLAQALAALRPLLATGPAGAEPLPLAGTRTRSGLFTRLDIAASAGPAAADSPRRDWVCECCVPEAEQALLRRAGPGRLGLADNESDEVKR
jgi:nicotinamide riboside kinase